MGKYGIVLEYHADIPPAYFHIVNTFFIKEEISPLDGIKPGNHPQKRRFTAPRGAEEGEKFLVTNIDGQVRNNRVGTISFYCILYRDVYTHTSDLPF
jgi:hypothetical protein